MLKSTAGDTLRHARWAKRLSIRELADKANVSTATIVKLENGGTVKQGEIIYALAEQLGLEAAPLFLEPPETAEVAS